MKRPEVAGDMRVGATAVLAALASQNAGAAVAKHLFPMVGAAGMTALRASLAAALLLVLRRAWRAGVPWVHLGAIARYGVALGLMNLLIYQAFARIPIGVAVAIEVSGPLVVALASARRARDLLWLAVAATGLWLLLPLHAGGLDPLGVVFAFGAAAAWALYIVFGKRVSATRDVDVVSWGMVAAMLVTLPFGLASAGSALWSPPALVLGLGVAILSSALPYLLEMRALRSLPAGTFGMFVSAAPAVAALAGFAILGEQLAPAQWLAIALIVIAVAGSASARPASPRPRRSRTAADRRGTACRAA